MFIRLMVLNLVKLERVVSFMKHLANLFSLIFLAKTFKFAAAYKAGGKRAKEGCDLKHLPIDLSLLTAKILRTHS